MPFFGCCCCIYSLKLVLVDLCSSLLCCRPDQANCRPIFSTRGKGKKHLGSPALSRVDEYYTPSSQIPTNHQIFQRCLASTLAVPSIYTLRRPRLGAAATCRSRLVRQMPSAQRWAFSCEGNTFAHSTVGWRIRVVPGTFVMFFWRPTKQLPTAVKCMRAHLRAICGPQFCVPPSVSQHLSSSDRGTWAAARTEAFSALNTIYCRIVIFPMQSPFLVVFPSPPGGALAISLSPASRQPFIPAKPVIAGLG